MNDFVANIFELWGGAYLGPFSQYMYRADLYIGIFLWLLLLPAITLFIYYKLWDNIRFSKLWIWCILVLVLSLAVGAIGYFNADAGIYDYLHDHQIKDSNIQDTDYLYFSLVCFGWAMIWSFLCSCLFKLISVKARHIPF